MYPLSRSRLAWRASGSDASRYLFPPPVKGGVGGATIAGAKGNGGNGGNEGGGGEGLGGGGEGAAPLLSVYFTISVNNYLLNKSLNKESCCCLKDLAFV